MADIARELLRRVARRIDRDQHHLRPRFAALRSSACTARSVSIAVGQMSGHEV